MASYFNSLEGLYKGENVSLLLLKAPLSPFPISLYSVDQSKLDKIGL